MCVLVVLAISRQSALAQPLVPADERTRKEILALQETYLELRKAGDLAGLGEMFDESYRNIWVDGRILNKADVMKLLAATTAGLGEIGYSRPDIFLMGENAVSIAVYRFSGELAGERFDTTARAVDIYAKRGDKWLAILGTTTKLEEPRKD
jgi:hypothetical protein